MIKCGTSDLLRITAKAKGDTLQIKYVNDFNGKVETNGLQIKILFNKIEREFLEKYSIIEIV